MRKLTEEELKLVQTAIIAKEISVLEVLAEIYDHYISHLEGFPESEFKSELANLESKWTYSYCHTLQHEFSKNVNKSIRSLQWKLIKSYFTWPKILSTTVFLGILFSLSQVLTPKAFIFSIIIPFMIIVQAFNIYLLFSAKRKYKDLRTIFNFKSTGLLLNSAESNGLSVAIGAPISVYNLLIFAPRFFDLNFGISIQTLFLILVFIAFLISVISFSAYEAWKIKSKTALL